MEKLSSHGRGRASTTEAAAPATTLQCSCSLTLHCEAELCSAADGEWAQGAVDRGSTCKNANAVIVQHTNMAVEPAKLLPPAVRAGEEGWVRRATGARRADVAVAVVV
jgi:hypothetical protein